MYKVGEFIDQTSGAGQPDPTQVFVVNPGTFIVGEEVHVLAGFTLPATIPAAAEGEKRTVASVAADHIVVNVPLGNTYPYSGPMPPGENAPYSFVAKVAAGAYEISPSSKILAKAFDDPFSEWTFVDGSSFLPFWSVQELTAEIFVDARSFAFFKNFNQTSPIAPRTNHVQLVAVGATDTGSNKGLTQSRNGANIGSNWSWVFTDNIAADCGGCTMIQLQNYREDVTAHELAHQWNVNPETSPDFHDSENAWNNPTRECLMNEARELALGVGRFHDSLTPSKDLYCIRGHVDDLNLDTCVW